MLRRYRVALYMRVDGRSWTEWETCVVRDRNDVWDAIAMDSMFSPEGVQGIAVFDPS